jgi:hypothetical protein
MVSAYVIFVLIVHITWCQTKNIARVLLHHLDRLWFISIKVVAITLYTIKLVAPWREFVLSTWNYAESHLPLFGATFTIFCLREHFRLERFT